MFSLNLNTEQRHDMHASIVMKIGHIETGNPKLRRNDAIDSREFSCIKKTTLEQDRLIVSLSNFAEKMSLTSPGRFVDVDDDLLRELQRCIKYRMGHIETGTAMRRGEVERYNNALGVVNASKARPVHALTTHQASVIQRLEKLSGLLDDLSFGASMGSHHGLHQGGAIHSEIVSRAPTRMYKP